MKPKAVSIFVVTLAIALLTRHSYAATFVALEGGFGDDEAHRIGAAVGWEWDKPLVSLGRWDLRGYWELSVSYWDTDRGRTGNDSLVDFGFAPVFRLQPELGLGIQPYIEGAVGIHITTHDEFGDKDFSIPFAFAPHAGAGIRFGFARRLELGYRFQHLSNAGLGEFNPGINFHLVHLSYYF